MKASKYLFVAHLLVIAMIAAACSGLPGRTTSGGGTGPFTVSVTVTGMSGSGLVVQNNGTDSLTFAANGTSAFKITIPANGAYKVTIQTQPSNPSQTCIVTGGTGTATANVTVPVNCSTGLVTIGGSVTGLSGTGLILQNNGKDSLTITAANAASFTFPTPIAVGTAYAVTVFVQPTSPSQTCVVSNGTGTAAGNVGNISITCSVGTISIGGTVSGLAGTGLVLQDNGSDKLTIAANGNFTFASLVPAGSTYAVTILTQPSGPNQTCTVSNGTGTATANVTSVQIICPAVFHSIGGTVVGVLGTTGNMQLQNNGGDNLPVSGNGSFTFVTQIAHGSAYDVTIFISPNTQPQGCIVWNYKGTATTDVTSVIVDCGHNDWTWMNGSNLTNQFGKSSTTPPVPPAINTDTPGGSKYSSSWTDKNGNLWLFSGYGFSHDSAVPNQPGFFNEMWEYTGTANYFGGYGNFWTMTKPAAASPVPAPRWGAVTWTDPTTGNLWLFAGQDASTRFLNDLWEYSIATSTWTPHGGGANLSGTYGTKGTGSVSNLPGGRWGATAKLDAIGNVWLFGGFGCDSALAACSNGLLNDLWSYNTTTKLWTWVSGSNVVNAAGVYGTQGTAASTNVPGGRQASVSWFDNAKNFWLFGGYNLSPAGQPLAFNDLWKFDTVANQWTWVSGANVVNQTGTYGLLGVAAAGNVPGARWSPAAWSDTDAKSGKTRLWIFGGQGYDATGNGSLGELWEFNISTNQWTWVKGPSSVGQSGIYGLAPNPVVWPYVVDNPGSRWGAAYWTDTSGQFWMFGGEGFDSTTAPGNGQLNDLWRYLPYPSTPYP